MADPLPVALNDDVDLLARIRAGDEAAFELVFLQNYQRLCIVAARMTGSDEEAEEVVQDALFRVWQQREKWEVTTTIAAYLTGAVRNHTLNRLNRGKLEQRWRERMRHKSSGETSLHGRVPTADSEMVAAELGGAIAAAIDGLPPRCRQAYLLRRHHDLSYAEIARVMRISPKTVEIQIGLALKALRKRLADWR